MFTAPPAGSDGCIDLCSDDDVEHFRDVVEPSCDTVLELATCDGCSQPFVVIQDDKDCQRCDAMVETDPYVWVDACEDPEDPIESPESEEVKAVFDSCSDPPPDTLDVTLDTVLGDDLASVCVEASLAGPAPTTPQKRTPFLEPRN